MKCIYCGKKLLAHGDFCCHSCELHYQEQTDKDRSKIKYFAAGMLIGFLVMLCGVLANHDFVMGAGIALMGMVVLLLPLTTPETIVLMGYQKSKIIGRVLGALLTAVGIWMVFFDH